VIDGKIYAAHSNYRFFPMTSSIEVWDARTMEHVGSHSIGIRLLEVDEIIPLGVRGQGIAWDRSSPLRSTLYGVIRATDDEVDQGITNKVVVFSSNVPIRPGRDGDKRDHGFEP
jgi:hypothetical protein